MIDFLILFPFVIAAGLGAAWLSRDRKMSCIGLFYEDRDEELPPTSVVGRCPRPLGARWASQRAHPTG
jgi:hypothetical protein